MTQNVNFFHYVLFELFLKSKGGFRRRAFLALYSTRINYLTLKISKCRLDLVHTAHYERGELNYCMKNFLSVNSMR